MKKIKGLQGFKVQLPAATYANLQKVKKPGESDGEAARRLTMIGAEKAKA